MPSPRLPEKSNPPDTHRDRLSVRFLGVHIEGVGRGVNLVVTALVIVGAVVLATVVLGHVL